MKNAKIQVAIVAPAHEEVFLLDICTTMSIDFLKYWYVTKRKVAGLKAGKLMFASSPFSQLPYQKYRKENDFFNGFLRLIKWNCFYCMVIEFLIVLVWNAVYIIFNIIYNDSPTSLRINGINVNYFDSACSFNCTLHPSIFFQYQWYRPPCQLFILPLSQENSSLRNHNIFLGLPCMYSPWCDLFA